MFTERHETTAERDAAIAAAIQIATITCRSLPDEDIAELTCGIRDQFTEAYFNTISRLQAEADEAASVAYHADLHASIRDYERRVL